MVYRLCLWFDYDLWLWLWLRLQVWFDRSCSYGQGTKVTFSGWHRYMVMLAALDRDRVMVLIKVLITIYDLCLWFNDNVWL